MFHKVVRLTVLATCLCMPFASHAANSKVSSKEILAAEINGEKVYRSAVERVHEAHSQLKMIPLEAVYERLLEHVVDSHLLGEAARKTNLADDPEVTKAIEALKEEVLRRFYLEREMDKLITEEKLKELYNEFIKENPPAKEVHARHILLENEKDAKAIVVELKNGADFIETAKKKSIGPSATRGGDLGYFTKEAMVPSFAEAAFAMEKGDVSEAPVKSDFGWHVIKVEDTRMSEQPTFEKIEPNLRAQSSEKAIAEIVKKLHEGVKVKLYDMDGSELKIDKEKKK